MNNVNRITIGLYVTGLTMTTTTITTKKTVDMDAFNARVSIESPLFFSTKLPYLRLISSFDFNYTDIYFSAFSKNFGFILIHLIRIFFLAGIRFVIATD